MLTAFKNAAMNPLFSLWDYGVGPWAVTGYTATRWKLIRTLTPTISARQTTVDASTAVDKWLRGQNALLLDVPTLAAGENAEIRQYQEAGNRHGRGLVNMKVMIAGPTGRTVKVGFNGNTTTVKASGISGSVSAASTAQSGGASTIQLANTESAVDGALVGKYIELVGGTGNGQIRKITAYTGATRTATVDAAWLTQPNNTTSYKWGSNWIPQYVEYQATMDDPAQEYVTIDPISSPQQGSWLIAAVQLEYVHNAPIASPWEIRPQHVERVLCNRYVLPVGYGQFGMGDGATSFLTSVRFPVQMRVAPTFVSQVAANATINLISSGGLVTAATPTYTVTLIQSLGARMKIDGFSATTANPYMLSSAVGIFDADY